MNTKCRIDVYKILRELDAKKQGENQYIANCPAHGDECPSLAIKVLNDSQALFYCHAGCKFKEIILALKNYKIIEKD